MSLARICHGVKCQAPLAVLNKASHIARQYQCALVGTHQVPVATH